MSMENAAQGHSMVEEEEAIIKNLQMAQVPMDLIIAPRTNLVTY
jgi:hypothetical protein